MEGSLGQIPFDHGLFLVESDTIRRDEESLHLPFRKDIKPA
jgi:hypothetical protein